MSDEWRDWLALTLVPGLGPRLTDLLIGRFGSPSAVLQATETDLRSVPHVGDKLAAQFARALRTVDPDAELERMAKFGVSVVIKGSANYPRHLETIADAPAVLYARGSLTPADQKAVAVVGTRVCTAYGRRMTERLGRDLARNGYTVVSGLARGIDGIAHKAALDGGGRTLAVLAGGLAKIYPPEHADLADRVAESGALLSETPMNMAPQPGMFHARNRLISGLSLGVVVVEANSKSGTLITVSHAAEQNKDVYAFPGNVDSDASTATNDLIRNQGAKLIRGIDDLMEDLQRFAVEPPPPAIPASIPPPALDEIQQRIWDYLSEPRHFDHIVRHLDASVPEVTRLMMRMEMARIVRRLPGNQYERRS